MHHEYGRGRNIITEEQITGLVLDKQLTAPMREFVRLETELAGQTTEDRDLAVNNQVTGFKYGVADTAARYAGEIGHGLLGVELGREIQDTMRREVAEQPEDLSEEAMAAMYDEAVEGMQARIGELYDEAAEAMPYPLERQETPEDAVY